jgi:hypothetical protein
MLPTQPWSPGGVGAYHGATLSRFSATIFARGIPTICATGFFCDQNPVPTLDSLLLPPEPSQSRGEGRTAPAVSNGQMINIEWVRDCIHRCHPGPRSTLPHKGSTLDCPPSHTWISHARRIALKPYHRWRKPELVVGQSPTSMSPSSQCCAGMDGRAPSQTLCARAVSCRARLPLQRPYTERGTPRQLRGCGPQETHSAHPGRNR